MTEISDAEAAEVLWASGEQGKAALRAAWERAKLLGIDRRADMADVSAIVYAAHLAAEPPEPGGISYTDDDSELPPAHLHHWVILRAQPHMPFVMIGKPPRYTIALVRCTECGMPHALTLAGEWTLEDLRATGDMQDLARKEGIA